MDFSPRVQRLIAEIRAVQLKAECSATQLAADVRQILLAATVDIEQRWAFLSMEDRVSAITDVVTVIRIYNRVFADDASMADVATRLTSKFLTEVVPPADAASLQVSALIEEVCPPNDAFSRTVGYARSQDDSIGVFDALETFLTLIRGYADDVASFDATHWGLERLHVEDVTAAEEAVLDFSTQIQELVAAAEDFARTVSFARTATEAVAATDAPAKTFTTSFSDTGGLYAVLNYFADDYVEEGTGPAVYDTFSYTLA